MKKDNKVLHIADYNSSSSLLGMAQIIEALKEQQSKLSENVAKIILKALDFKDHYTFGHSVRVAYFSKITGQQLDMGESELKELELAGLFHDIGKIGTPDSVLNKPSRLDEKEFGIMKNHPVISYEILKDFPGFEKIALFAKHHHERYDGKGYPNAMKGDDIPLASRIILIADTFDAMTSSRPYRKGLTYEVAFSELQEFSGSQFDPLLVTAFLEGLKKEIDSGTEEFFIATLDQKYSRKAA